MKRRARDDATGPLRAIDQASTASPARPGCRPAEVDQASGAPVRPTAGDWRFLQHVQVEPVGRQLKGRYCVAVVECLPVTQAAARPGGAVLRQEAQVRCPEFPFLALVENVDPALQRLQNQGGSIVCADFNGLQCDVTRQTLQCSLLHVGPQAQCPGALVDFQPHPGTQVHVFVHSFQIHLGKLAVERARPFAPAAGVGDPQRLAELAAQAEAGAPLRRWCGVQPQLVLAARVAHHQIQRMQCQGRGLGLHLVGPTDLAVPDHEFGLGEKPVQHGVRLLLG